MNLFQPFRAEVEKAGNAVSDTIDFLTGKINALWNVQHNATGGHTNITATNLAITRGTDQDVAAGTNLGNVTATGDGPHTFGGDVIAEFGDGTECGIGVLGTVNGVTLLSGVALRHGLLLGGAATGFFLVKKARSGDFGGSANFQLSLYDLANAPATAPVLQLAQDTAITAYSLIDGGAGSTRVEIGSFTRRMQAFYGDSFIDANGTHGAWTSVTFAAGNFTGNGTITWTVAAGDQAVFAYTLINKTMTVAFKIETTTVAGAGNQLLIKIPGGFTAAKEIYNPLAYTLDNGVYTPAFAVVVAGGTNIQIARTDLANWAAATDATRVSGQITFEVQ